MKFDIITIFPKIFNSYFSESILRRAQKNNLIEIGIHDLRDYSNDKHKRVDDRPYGGGAGMIFMVEPIYFAVKELCEKNKISVCHSGLDPESRILDSRLRGNDKKKGKREKNSKRVILFSAKGKAMDQSDARRWAKYDQLILICGRYEGVDERVAEHIADEEISVGNYVLTGGEIPVMIVVDAVSRLIPGVLGKKESLEEESFNNIGVNRKKPAFAKASADAPFSSSAFGGKKMGEYPQYTRPENFRGWKVPKILLSGDHEEIKKWREETSKKL